jgi:hypothetical protein
LGNFTEHGDKRLQDDFDIELRRLFKAMISLIPIVMEHHCSNFFLKKAKGLPFSLIKKKIVGQLIISKPAKNRLSNP